MVFLFFLDGCLFFFVLRFPPIFFSSFGENGFNFEKKLDIPDGWGFCSTIVVDGDVV